VVREEEIFSGPAKLAMVQPVAIAFNQSPDEVFLSPIKYMKTGDSASFGWDSKETAIFIYSGSPDFHGLVSIVPLEAGRVVYVAPQPGITFSLKGKCAIAFSIGDVD
jgi:hypothetical protein